MRLEILAPIAVALSLLGSSATAQELRKPGPRQGYFLSGGFRLALLNVDADEIGNIGSTAMPGLILRGGEMVNEWLGLGGQIRTAFGGNDVFGTSYGAGLMEGQFQPLRQHNFVVRVGAGAYGLFLSREDPELEREDDPDTGFGPIFAVGVAYDLFPFRRNGSLRSGGFGVSLTLEGEALVGSDVRAYGVVFGIELTGFFGLNRYKLDLPVEEAFEAR